MENQHSNSNTQQNRKVANLKESLTLKLGKPITSSDTVLKLVLRLADGKMELAERLFLFMESLTQGRNPLSATITLLRSKELTIAFGKLGLMALSDWKRKRKRTTALSRVLKFGELFAFLLPPKIRREAYEPAYNDLLADFLLARRYKSLWARRWLLFCFLVRTGWMIAESFRVMFGQKLRKMLWDSFVELLRRG